MELLISVSSYCEDGVRLNSAKFLVIKDYLFKL